MVADFVKSLNFGLDNDGHGVAGCFHAADFFSDAFDVLIFHCIGFVPLPQTPNVNGQNAYTLKP